MTQLLVQLRDRIFVKGCRLLSFTKNMSKNIGKKISKNVSGEYSLKRLGHSKQSATHILGQKE